MKSIKHLENVTQGRSNSLKNVLLQSVKSIERVSGGAASLKMNHMSSFFPLDSVMESGHCTEYNNEYKTESNDDCIILNTDQSDINTNKSSNENEYNNDIYDEPAISLVDRYIVDRSLRAQSVFSEIPVEAEQIILTLLQNVDIYSDCTDVVKDDRDGNRDNNRDNNRGSGRGDITRGDVIGEVSVRSLMGFTPDQRSAVRLISFILSHCISTQGIIRKYEENSEKLKDVICRLKSSIRSGEDRVLQDNTVLEALRVRALCAFELAKFSSKSVEISSLPSLGRLVGDLVPKILLVHKVVFLSLEESNGRRDGFSSLGDRSFFQPILASTGEAMLVLGIVFYVLLNPIAPFVFTTSLKFCCIAQEIENSIPLFDISHLYFP